MKCNLLTEDIIPEYSVDSHINRAEQFDTFTKMITFHPKIGKVRWQNTEKGLGKVSFEIKKKKCELSHFWSGPPPPKKCEM